MRKLAMALAASVMAAALCSGTAGAAEANPPALRGGGLRGVRAAGRPHFGPRLEIRPVAFMGWRDTCARKRLILPEGTVDWPGEIGFAMTRRFSDARGASPPGSFLGMLARELAIGMVLQ